MDKELKQLLDGKFELPLAECELRQCGTDKPITYCGSGLISQDADRNLELRMFADGVEIDEALMREWSSNDRIGMLVPERGFYDLSCTDIRGNRWVAKRLTLSISYGVRTYIQSKLWRLEEVSAHQTIKEGRAEAFCPTSLDLPWHLSTTTPLPNGATNIATDRFEHETDQFAWRIKKQDDGIFITFKVEDGEIESRFSSFLRALSILTGRPLQPLLVTFRRRNQRIKRLQDRNSKLLDVQLQPPLPMTRPQADSAHKFLISFLERSLHQYPGPQDCGVTVYTFWHRIVRARPNDIENSSLILSTAIEGLINQVFASEHDVDAEFLSLIDQAEATLKKAKLHQRIYQYITSSLHNAKKPRPQDVLRRLIEQGAIKKAHLLAWQELRHPSAHGATLQHDERALQKHIDRFHCCVDLFYRLVFLAIGYHGVHIDYSNPGSHDWLQPTFPPTPQSDT